MACGLVLFTHARVCPKDADLQVGSNFRSSNRDSTFGEVCRMRYSPTVSRERPIYICITFSINMEGWRSGESALLPPMCPGFDSRTRRHMWVEFVVGSLLCSERFFSGYSGFPLSSKTNI